MNEKDLINTRIVLERWGDDVIKSMRDILIQNGKNASSNLSNSLRYVITYNGEDLDIEFEMADYGLFVDKGRAPGKQPPIQAITPWLQLKGIPQSAAFPIARKIGKDGIKPTPFFESEIEKNQDNLIKLLEEAYVKDLELYYQKRLSSNS